MRKIIKIPHEVHESTCYVNGLFDILKWKGAEYSYFLLPIIGGMANFAYLKFKMAQPPCMVYWGNSPKYLMEQLQEVIGFTQTLSEGKAFKNEFPRIKSYLDKDVPVVVGALDMFYLHYYPDLYQNEHIPIHYLLVVGYDDEQQIVYVHDCSVDGVQEIPYREFESCLNISTPGLSRKNTCRVFTLPGKLPSELEIGEKGFTYKAQRMLKPPVSMFGIPAMRKLAREITGWTDESCLNHMVAYAGMTPPLIAEDLSHNDGLRFQEASLFKEMGQKYGRKNWIEASRLFRQSGESIIELSQAALDRDLAACSTSLDRIADLEETAYKLLV
jgi:hypothetical protein